jgi:hypothetical protein
MMTTNIGVQVQHLETDDSDAWVDMWFWAGRGGSYRARMVFTGKAWVALFHDFDANTTKRSAFVSRDEAAAWITDLVFSA